MAPNMDPSRMATKLMSWNVRAINNPAKRSKVFSHLRDQGVEIVYLQETHLLNRDHLKLCRGGFYQVYHSDFNSKGRGVAILIHRNVQFVETTTIKDKHGRYVIVVGKLFNMPVVLAKWYTHIHPIGIMLNFLRTYSHYYQIWILII